MWHKCILWRGAFIRHLHEIISEKSRSISFFCRSMVINPATRQKYLVYSVSFQPDTVLSNRVNLLSWVLFSNGSEIFTIADKFSQHAYLHKDRQINSRGHQHFSGSNTQFKFGCPSFTNDHLSGKPITSNILRQLSHVEHRLTMHQSSLALAWLKWVMLSVRWS